MAAWSSGLGRTLRLTSLWNRFPCLSQEKVSSRVYHPGMLVISCTSQIAGYDWVSIKFERTSKISNCHFYSNRDTCEKSTRQPKIKQSYSEMLHLFTGMLIEPYVSYNLSYSK